MIDTEIEVFRADTRASRGITAERLASVAEFDCEANPIPCVIGHPKSDSPAEGVIKGFRLDGSKLFAKVANASAKLVEGIKSGAILNRSMAFFDEDHEANPTPGKLAPRHLGFLGGSAPGIPGMTSLSKSLAFAADDEAGDNLLVEGDPAPAVVYAPEPTTTVTVFEAKEPEMSGTPTPTPTPTPAPTGEKSAAELAFEAREAAFAQRIRTQFEARNGSSIDALVRGGQVLPAEAADLKLAFNSLDPEAEELTFGAGDKTTKATAVDTILAFMAGLPKRVPLGKRESPSIEFNADEPNGVKPSAITSAAGDAAELTVKAEKLMKGNPSLSFEAAIERVSGGGNLDDNA